MIFSVILVIFHIASPMLPMTASDYYHSTDASHVARIISTYCQMELLSDMRFH
jgi:hypothetical protein